MKYCVCCGSPIPGDQGSSTCSMCYGDIGHGRDGYYQEWAERQELDDWPQVDDPRALNDDEEAPKAHIDDAGRVIVDEEAT